MVALVVLALGMLASVVGIMSALNHNMLNDYRSQAVALAQQQAEVVRNQPYTTAPSDTTSTVSLPVRNASVPFTVSTTYKSYTPSGGSYPIYLAIIKVSWNAQIGNQIQTLSYSLDTLAGQSQ